MSSEIPSDGSCQIDLHFRLPRTLAVLNGRHELTMLD
jgi:hypothetical protein